MKSYSASFLAAIVVIIIFVGMALWQKPAMADKTGQENNGMQYNKLTSEEKAVIIDKGTERPFSGKYVYNKEKGLYVCKQCNAPLFRSSDKFDSDCGWPSFDDAIPGAVKQTLDADGHRIEITCANCGAHLGHVFTGEGFTPKNVRNCVNSISLNFVPEDSIKLWPAAITKDNTGKSMEMNPAAMSKDNAGKAAAMDPAPAAATSTSSDPQKAYFAGGCFWGVEYMLEELDGVIDAKVGYMGGHTKNPTYAEVCDHNTGYAETVEVTFDPSKISYEELAKYFFEIHDPTQMDRQGPDIGDQYRSEVFYTNDNQKMIAEKLINILKDKGYKVVTRVAKAGTFYPAESCHQDYYEKNGHTPYCHVYTKRF
jgi:peptide methionine sulfoxide reductase msrA/msrB